MTGKKKVTANDIGPWFLLVLIVGLSGGYIWFVGLGGLIMLGAIYALVALMVFICAVPNILAWAINKIRGV